MYIYEQDVHQKMCQSKPLTGSELYLNDPLSYVTCCFQFCFLVTLHCFVQFGLCPPQLSCTLLSNHFVVIVMRLWSDWFVLWSSFSGFSCFVHIFYNSIFASPIKVKLFNIKNGSPEQAKKHLVETDLFLRYVKINVLIFFTLAILIHKTEKANQTQ